MENQENLTLEQIEEKARIKERERIEEKSKVLSEQLKCNVKPLFFIDPETKENVVGFVKEPDRALKLRMLDKSQQDGSFTFASAVYDSIIIKEESDPRLTSTLQKDDKYYFGGVLAAYEMVEISTNYFKKK